MLQGVSCMKTARLSNKFKTLPFFSFKEKKKKKGLEM